MTTGHVTKYEIYIKRIIGILFKLFDTTKNNDIMIYCQYERTNPSICNTLHLTPTEMKILSLTKKIFRGDYVKKMEKMKTVYEITKHSNKNVNIIIKYNGHNTITLSSIELFHMFNIKIEK